MKKIFAAALLALSLPLFAGEKYLFSSKKAVKDKESVKFNTEISAIDLVKDMKCGWNLGNTLDANAKQGLESETSWGQPLTTKEMIDAIAASGIKTIRIPCSWANHLIDDKYTIDSEWMKRVKQIVDWAIQDGMYVILNDHHDNYDHDNLMPRGKGYYPSTLNYNESMLFVKNIWAQISLAFNKGYDEHLIFEVLNEPRRREHEHEWWYNQGCTLCRDAASSLNKLNQIALNTIRASGKNNAKRFVMVTGLAASINSYQADNSWKMPKDTEDGRILISVHLYTPYTFAMQNPGETTFEEKHAGELKYNFDWLNERFVSKGIPVVIGEYGATNKNNPEERAKWFEYFIRESSKYGMVCVLWDNGDWNASNTFEEKFGFFNRKTNEWYFPEILKTILDNCSNN